MRTSHTVCSHSYTCYLSYITEPPEPDDDANINDPEERFGPKLDKNGLPLVPQPTDDPSDPLNFPQWLKVVILLQASVMALLGPFNSAVINPGT